jgi:CDP-6-deoxy-D-xylo-4-hexulose-3-dehydrase
MNENLDSKRNEIASLVEQFAEIKLSEKEFKAGIDPVPVSGKVLSPRDYVSLVDASLDGWLTAGRFTKIFEKNLATFIGARSSLFVNSGSSANLLALTALTSKNLGARALKPGDEVLTVAMGFPTTVNPIIQNNLRPVVVDVDLETLDVDETYLEEAISPKTKAIMLAHTLGNPFNLDLVRNLCEKYNLWLIEDSCDALGSKYRGQKTGSFGDTATLSFYPAHHITTGEGGAVLVKSPLVKKQVESFRDWGRDCYCETGMDNTCKKRFEWQLGTLPQGYDHKYTYSHIGYNLKSTDMQAALGVSQLENIEYFTDKRIKNYEYLKKNLENIAGIKIASATPNSEPSWFGCPITLDENHPVNREDMLRFLESRKIGTRLIFAGNITRQPGYKDVDFRVVGSLANTDKIMARSFWIGVYPGLNFKMLDYVIDSITGYMNGTLK